MQVGAGQFAQPGAFLVVFFNRRLDRGGGQKLFSQAIKHPLFQIFHLDAVCIVTGAAFAPGAATQGRAVDDGEGSAA
ncbi:hypothetical protein AUQ41_08640 [Thalassospira sp. MCCC 1A02898]|nr:hypothetical protein AUQ41_08640 [Thalassospira sp. MCCC 1A02898]